MTYHISHVEWPRGTALRPVPEGDTNMTTLDGKPRYEIQELPHREWKILDTKRQTPTIDTPRSQSEADRICAALNREYQHWLTDRFYDKAGWPNEVVGPPGVLGPPGIQPPCGYSAFED